MPCRRVEEVRKGWQVLLLARGVQPILCHPNVQHLPGLPAQISWRWRCPWASWGVLPLIPPRQERLKQNEGQVGHRQGYPRRGMLSPTTPYAKKKKKELFRMNLNMHLFRQSKINAILLKYIWMGCDNTPFLLKMQVFDAKLPTNSLRLLLQYTPTPSVQNKNLSGWMICICLDWNRESA